MTKEELIVIMSEAANRIRQGASAALKYYILEFAEAIEKKMKEAKS